MKSFIKEYLLDISITLIAVVFCLLYGVAIVYGRDIILGWDANDPPPKGYRVWAAPYRTYRTETPQPPFGTYTAVSVILPFDDISTVHQQTEVRVKVDGRRNWEFFVTAFDDWAESKDSNHVRVPR